MKFFLNLFVFLFVIASPYNNIVKGKHIYSEKESFTVNTVESPVIAISERDIRTIDSGSSDGALHKQKKRNRKGVKSVPFFIANESQYRINNIDNKLTLLNQLAYSFHSFSANGKRGPPSGCYIS